MEFFVRCRRTYVLDNDKEMIFPILNVFSYHMLIKVLRTMFDLSPQIRVI